VAPSAAWLKRLLVLDRGQQSNAGAQFQRAIKEVLETDRQGAS